MEDMLKLAVHALRGGIHNEDTRIVVSLAAFVCNEVMSCPYSVVHHPYYQGAQECRDALLSALKKGDSK